MSNDVKIQTFQLVIQRAVQDVEGKGNQDVEMSWDMLEVLM